MTEEVEYLIANTIPSVPDQRDIPYHSPYRPEDLPASVNMQEDVYEIENQGPIGSCVANGVVSSCELIANRNEKPIDLSRLFLYNATKVYSNRIGKEGLNTKDAYHVAYKYGMPEEDYYPYDITKDNIKPTLEDYKKAFNNRIKRYESVAQRGDINNYKKIHNIKSTLAEGLPVGFAMLISSSLMGFVGTWSEHRYKGINKDNRGIGGHYMLIVGYDDKHQKFLIQNSWGVSWGDKGYGGLPYSIVREPFFEAWMARSFKDMEIPEIPGIKLEFMNGYRLEARIVPEKKDIGKSVNLWIGGRSKEGHLYVKKSLQSDKWVPLEEVGVIGSVPPVQKDYLLGKDNHIKVVNWMDLSKFKGSKIYIGYGADIFSMKVEKIVTL